MEYSINIKFKEIWYEDMER